MVSVGFSTSAALLGWAILNYVPSSSLTMTPRRGGWTRMRQGSTVFHMAANGEEPDLFEYFDPTLSPHAYPNGVSPTHKPDEDVATSETDQERYDPMRLNVRSDFRDTTHDDNTDKRMSASDVYDPTLSPKADAHVAASNVFDPTLSPHAYPKGTPSTIVGDETSEEDADLFGVFDPTLSPHAYPNGIPSTTKTTSTSSRIGILLMDHGSRNQASNDRLHELARRYQETVGSHVVVRAAHMELASPSIPEGMETLLKAGVEEIICHPYFLSPHGRHVAEDIPRIVDDAIQSLDIDIPVVTTDPVGAHTEVMINAIQSIVKQSSSRLRRNGPK